MSDGLPKEASGDARPSARLRRLRDAVRHAFALPQSRPLTPDEAALLDDLAARVRRRGLEGPAVLAVESVRPLGTLAANGTYALQPFLELLLDPAQIETATRLMQHPGAIDRFVAAINGTPDVADRSVER